MQKSFTLQEGFLADEVSARKLALLGGIPKMGTRGSKFPGKTGIRVRIFTAIWGSGSPIFGTPFSRENRPVGLKTRHLLRSRKSNAVRRLLVGVSGCGVVGALLLQR